jgi:DNA replication protein DnaC
MAISAEHYDTILREYDQRQYAVQRDLTARQEAIYKAVPRLQEIRDELASLQVSKAKLRLAQNAFAQEEISQKIQALIDERNLLLIENGYSTDALSPHYYCKDCKDTGYTAAHKMCHCFKQALIDVMYDQSNVKNMLKQCNFAHFNLAYYDDKTVDGVTGKTPRQNMEDTVAYCEQYIHQFSTNFRNLLFYGETGVGKSFLSYCIANELLAQSYSVLYLSAIDFSNIMAEAVFNTRAMSTESKNTLQFIYDCDLLIVDDLGTEITNSVKSSNLFHCLDKRLQNSKSTIINTNLSPREISQTYSDRIFSRIIGNYTCFKITGEDIRKKKRL